MLGYEEKDFINPALEHLRPEFPGLSLCLPGDTLFARNAGLSLNPASTLKLYTTALAFEQLGPDHRFTTDVYRQGSLSNGTLTGNLILRGGGDPALSRRSLPAPGSTA